MADCYLRFRLAKSDVERFLCLLDCFEVLIKQSVIVLALRKFAGEGSRELDSLIQQLERPSLGIWRNILQSLVNDLWGERESQGVEKTIRLFWQKAVEPPARELIDAVNGLGLTWKGNMPRNYLEWLEWLTWLRNVTRGHGAVEDRVASPIWHRFHALFLQVVNQLRPLVLDSSLAVRNDTGTMDVLSGWLRGPARSSRLSWSLPQSISDELVFPVLRSSYGELPLQPFVCVRGNHCLTWNSRREAAIEYVDYSDGKLERVRGS